MCFVVFWATPFRVAFVLGGRVRRITGSKIFDGREAPELFPADRKCVDPRCGVLLSRYNAGPACNVHKALRVVV